MSRFITDTHPLIWHLTDAPRLSVEAQRVFTEADSGLHQILVPGIVLIEMVYLAEKGVVPTALLNQLFHLLDTPGGSYAIAPLDQAVARTMLDRVPWSAIPELADRIIAATAISLQLPLLTKDRQIHGAALVSILW